MKILCVLYDDPKEGMPNKYALDSIPKLETYPDGMTLPTPKAIDFNPGDLLGCVSGELGLRKFLEDRGHTLVVTADKDGELAGMGAHSYSKGSATGGSEEAAKYKQQR